MHHERQGEGNIFKKSSKRLMLCFVSRYAHWEFITLHLHMNHTFLAFDLEFASLDYLSLSKDGMVQTPCNYVKYILTSFPTK